MPVKWTPETDQILLLKILETSSINADVKAIAQAWPEGLDKPTPRAITERLVKIRQTAKSSGSTAHFSVSKGSTSGNGTPTATPRKRTVGASNWVKKTPPKNTGTTVNSTPTKRKHAELASGDNASEDDELAIKPETAPTDAFSSDDNDSPIKRPKPPAFIKHEHSGHRDMGYSSVQGSGFASGFGDDGAGGYDGAVFA